MVLGMEDLPPDLGLPSPSSSPVLIPHQPLRVLRFGSLKWAAVPGTSSVTVTSRVHIPLAGCWHPLGTSFHLILKRSSHLHRPNE